MCIAAGAWASMHACMHAPGHPLPSNPPKHLRLVYVRPCITCQLQPTAWYSPRSSYRKTSLPRATLPKKLTRGSFPTAVNWLSTFCVRGGQPSSMGEDYVWMTLLDKLAYLGLLMVWSYSRAHKTKWSGQSFLSSTKTRQESKTGLQNSCVHR